MERYMESELSVPIKLFVKNIVLGFPRNPTSNCLCCVLPLSEETNQCSEPVC